MERALTRVKGDAVALWITTMYDSNMETSSEVRVAESSNGEPRESARPRWRWASGVIAGLLSALAVGVPTDVIANPYFTRMTPVRWWDYVVLAATLGLTVVWAILPGASQVGATQAPTASVLGTLAVGCPLCNKAVVALLGATGAAGVWAPLQPVLGAGAVALLVVAIRAKRGAGRSDIDDSQAPSCCPPYARFGDS